MIKFIPIERSDFPEWQEMRKAIYPGLDEDFDAKEMVAILGSELWYCWFIVNNYQQTVGLVELSLRNIVDGCLSSPVAYLEGLYLKPDFRGQGIGREVMQLLMQWCQENGLSELATDAEIVNKAAQKFYTALGFEEVDRVVEYKIDIKPI